MKDINSNQSCAACPSKLDGICPSTDAKPSWGVRGRLVAFKADQVIEPYGSDRAKIYVLRSGLVRVQRYALDGRRHILLLILPGEVVGSSRDDGMTYETVTDCVVCEVERRTSGPRATALMDCTVPLYKQQAIQLDRLRWMTWFLGTLVPEERICAFLAFAPRFMPTKINPDGSVDLTMLLGRADLADFLGTTPETVSRITHKLQDSGILAIHTAQSFTILDMHQLIQRGHMPLYYYAQPLDDYGLAPHPDYAPPAPANAV